MQAGSLSCMFLTGPSLLYGKNRVKQMICKVSQCYKVIAWSNPFASFQLPFPVLLGDTELSVPFSSCCQPHHPTFSFSFHSADGSVLSPPWRRIAVLNCHSSKLLLFNSPRFLWQLICALQHCIGHLLCTEFPSPGCDSLARFSFRQTRHGAWRLLDFSIWKGFY